ncbi:hypothetical protein T484DRAFT_1954749 [Baffinella frigidus]|nr:hypothetical protein T484DRAFT_1954749 [Cryptophyta sp. CCMP2293]
MPSAHASATGPGSAHEEAQRSPDDTWSLSEQQHTPVRAQSDPAQPATSPTPGHPDAPERSALRLTDEERAWTSTVAAG